MITNKKSKRRRHTKKRA